MYDRILENFTKLLKLMDKSEKKFHVLKCVEEIREMG